MPVLTEGHRNCLRKFSRARPVWRPDLRQTADWDNRPESTEILLTALTGAALSIVDIASRIVEAPSPRFGGMLPECL